ncbi:putative transcriptional regulator [Roseovarius mucosus DSM 17069]|uniref:Putative transcriptional regulator n=1 Tax=Roseovarius mucosus DSM 17069 TaxID=1288298 RepID=A0A0A0HL86_9RHOB|nr:MerR family transcriptional regulator [Roseovarius mucosus]KGM88622.1 putative transcriptional regulator [Roseovarius mucosus DSM 17069]
MGKAADAFRTISEVADWLDVPAHVLRFWESKFTQVKPVKRAGGRRYYRPADMALLGGIKVLLHDQGMTIKGAQKYLRENGIQQVADMSPPLDEESQGAESGIALDVAPSPAKPAEVVTFARPAEPQDTETDTSAEEIDAEPQGSLWSQDSTKPEATAPLPEPMSETAPIDTPADPEIEQDTTGQTPAPEPEPVLEPEPATEATESAPPTETASTKADPSPDDTAAAPSPPRDLPADPTDHIDAAPGLLTAIGALPRPISPECAARLAPLVANLRAHVAAHTKDR